MASESGDRNTIRIGGDAAGPVVAGRDNHVKVHQSQPGASGASGASGAPGVEDGSTPADEARTPDSSQTNTASGHGTVFTVMHGDMHVHQDDDRGTAGDH